MDRISKQNNFQQTLTEEVDSLCQRVFQSLVIVHSGRHGAGAGLIWRQDGSIVTNYHVLRKGPPRIADMDGHEYKSEVIARDKQSDLALLKINTPKSLLPAPLADSRRLRVGQFTLAVGHPWGQIGAVSAGIITSLGSVPMRWRRRSVEVIRADAGLAPGSSGGPLLDAKGGVIGLNTMIMGGDLGVAIPSHVVDEFVNHKIG